MATITVRQIGSTEPMEFAVEVRERGGQTRHRVTMTRATHTALCGSHASPEQCIRAAFAFLLDREPKESILERFDVTVISRYFPEFATELGKYLPDSD